MVSKVLRFDAGLLPGGDGEADVADIQLRFRRFRLSRAKRDD